jgi:hypothetical protein
LGNFQSIVPDVTRAIKGGKMKGKVNIFTFCIRNGKFHWWEFQNGFIAKKNIDLSLQVYIMLKI